MAGGSILSCVMPGYGIPEYNKEQQENFISSVKQYVFNKSMHMPDTVPQDILNHGLNGFFSSDIDLFVYGTTVQQASQRMLNIIQQVIANNGADVIMRSQQAITILGKG